MGESDRHFLERTRGKLDLAIGLLIGMGGFAELTIVGMITWIIKQSPITFISKKEPMV